MKLYTYNAVKDLMDRYLDKGGDVYEIEEGSLAQGLTICMAEGYKTAIINEVYLNEWSSGQKVRFYNRLPKKYEKMIDNAIAKYERWYAK